MYDDILLPTDGSEGMTVVIEHARSLARIHDARLHVLYVVETTSLTDLPMESSIEGVYDALYDEGESALAAVEQQLDDVPVETSLVEGSPAQEIIAAAEDQACDLVVMGTHGRSGVDRFLLGSVAERVVRSSPVPVMTVRVEADD